MMDAKTEKEVEELKEYVAQHWRKNLKRFSVPDSKAIRNNMEAAAENAVQKLFGDAAYLVGVSVETDPENPQKVILTFTGPEALIKYIQNLTAFGPDTKEIT
jgi:hypothetical protein